MRAGDSIFGEEHIMSRYRPFLVFAAAVVSCGGYPCPANADVEGRMPPSHIQFDSEGLDNSGPVHVEVNQTAAGISEIRVTAFGSLHTLPVAQLAGLQGRHFNALGVTYSRGYSSTGGRSVYILLCQAFSSGANVAAVVTLTEKGGVRVRAIEPSVAQ